MVSVLTAFISVAMITTDFGDKLSLSSIQKGAVVLKGHVEAHYGFAVSIFVLTYIIVNLWFPAAALLTLLAGFLYGTVWGALYVDVAATLGAVAAFEISRNMAGQWIQDKWDAQLQRFNRAVVTYGCEYLLMVRMIPLMPYFLVNFLAGLTKVRTLTFAWTTALGSLPSILIFCHAGRQLLTIKSVDQVLTVNVIVTLALVAGFIGSVIVIKWALRKTRHQTV
jgi:uncharacterized membrane protein YdjX (TVP38/TMEM64 family)